jgi:N4-gp56 family major capsid protein
MLSGAASADAVAVKQWDDKALYEYQDQLVLAPWMGTTSESFIFVKDVFKQKEGDVLNIPLIAALSGEGVKDDDTLEDNEEALTPFNFQVTLHQYRHAMRTKGKLSAKRTAFDYKDQFRPLLTAWLAQKTETHLFDALSSIDGVDYVDATEAQKDAWLANNSDRVLFGAAKSNNSANDHSASLSNVDNTNDKFTTNIINLAKRMAKRANPKVRPIRIKKNADSGAKEMWVMFADTLCLRDLEADTAWQNAQNYARERGDDNPMFSGAYGVWRAVILVESEKNLRLDNVGASSIDVAANFLCGAQALVFAPAGDDTRMDAQVTMTEETFDYGNQVGVAIAAMYGHGKAVFNSKQHSVVTVYCASVED